MGTDRVLIQNPNFYFFAPSPNVQCMGSSKFKKNNILYPRPTNIRVLSQPCRHPNTKDFVSEISIRCFFKSEIVSSMVIGDSELYDVSKLINIGRLLVEGE